jgi:hypothetical protein
MGYGFRPVHVTHLPFRQQNLRAIFAPEHERKFTMCQTLTTISTGGMWASGDSADVGVICANSNLLGLLLILLVSGRYGPRCQVHRRFYLDIQ